MGPTTIARTIRDAFHAGISVLFQELNVVNQLSVEQNLTLGIEEAPLGIVREGNASRAVVETLRALDPSIPPNASVSLLSFAKKQVIEIAKAVATNAEIIIMDEPTAALSEEEVKRLFSIIGELKKNGVTILYITHRLDEIFKIGDFVTVFRDGKVISTVPVARDLIEGGAGSDDDRQGCRTLLRAEQDRQRPQGPRGARRVHWQGFEYQLRPLRREILGFYGLVGSGKTEIAKAIYGVDRITGGAIRLQGAEAHIAGPRDALRQGIAMVPEERRSEGLLTRLSIRENISIMNPRKISRYWICNQNRERAIARQYVHKLRIVTESIEKIVALLERRKSTKGRCFEVPQR